MKRQFFIIDTNVVVAALLTADAGSPVARVLEGMLGAMFAFVVSEALLAEYRTVLLRPRIRAVHGCDADEIDMLLTQIARHAIELSPGPGSPAPDPGDQFLWDLLDARADLVLVTGDKLLLHHAGIRGRALSPGDFIAAL
jgi:predicted nucleic acid-binding protein